MGEQIGRREVLKATGAAVAIGAFSTRTAATEDDPTDCIDNSLTPEDDADVLGTVEFSRGDVVTVTYEIRDADALTVKLSEGEQARTLRGFESTSRDRRFRWDGSRSDPSITYDGVSVSSFDMESGIFRTPDHPEPDQGTVRLTAADGVVSRNLMYIGGKYVMSPLRRGCEDIRIIEPCGVHVASTGSDVLDSLETASEYLDVGHRYSEFTLFAAKDVLSLGTHGVYVGDGDAALNASRPTNSPTDTWTHEYVHSRQAGNMASDMKWWGEASAEYYAARVTLEAEAITAASYERQINQGRAYTDTVLSDPDEWEPHAEYAKGALVLAHLDQRITDQSDGEDSLVTVFRRANDSVVDVTYSDFRGFVTDVAHADTGDWLDTYVTTDRVPPDYQYDGEKGTGLDAYLIQARQVASSAGDYVSHVLAPPGECGRSGYLL